MSACGTRNAGLLFLAPQVLITAEGEPGPLGSPAHTERTSSASGLPKNHGAACGVALSDEKLVAIAKILRGTYGHLCELNRFPAGASAAMLHIPLLRPSGPSVEVPDLEVFCGSRHGSQFADLGLRCGQLVP
jgi:hypothetical protein